MKSFLSDGCMRNASLVKLDKKTNSGAAHQQAARNF
jgi:hypothetical protein